MLWTVWLILWKLFLILHFMFVFLLYIVRRLWAVAEGRHRQSRWYDDDCDEIYAYNCDVVNHDVVCLIITIFVTPWRSVTSPVIATVWSTSKFDSLDRLLTLLATVFLRRLPATGGGWNGLPSITRVLEHIATKFQRLPLCFRGQAF